MVNENGNGANGLTRQFVYETNTLRLNTIRAGTASPFENLQKLSYTYDNNGNVKTLVDSTNGGQKQCRLRVFSNCKIKKVLAVMLNGDEK